MRATATSTVVLCAGLLATHAGAGSRPGEDAASRRVRGRRLESARLDLATATASSAPDTPTPLIARRERNPPPAGPRLDLRDQFLPFVPGVFRYDRRRGDVVDQQTILNFGLSTLSFNFDPSVLHIQPPNDEPNVTARVRLTVSESNPNRNPSGDVTVNGLRFHHDPIDLDDWWSEPVHDTVHFSSNGTVTTDQYFDQVTSVTTAGLGMNTTLKVAWWAGHEQEMDVAVAVVGVTETDCGDYVVYFNGQEAPAEWVEDTSSCVAGLLAHALGPPALYFGIDPHDEADTFLSRPTPVTWRGWIGGLPYGQFLWDVDPSTEPMVRPIVVELARAKEQVVVDAARLLLWTAVNPFGAPTLVAMPADTVSPGAFTQLSPRGLGRLEPTHAATLPYPIQPAGTQPRLSARAIGLAPRRGVGSVAFDLTAAFDYWTDDNPDSSQGEFAGHLAYEDILDEAWEDYFKYLAELFRCQSEPPPLDAQCALDATAKYCVRLPPGPADFKVHVDGLTTYFDPGRPDDALVVGDVTGMDLTFGDNQVDADFVLENIAGKLEGVIDPGDVRIEYKKALGDTCTVKPEDRQVADFVAGAVDYEGWFTCRDLSFSAASALLADPLPFDFEPSGESFATPFAGARPDFSLVGVAGQATTGTCGESWMADFAETQIVAWQYGVTSAIEADWIVSPSQDEALDRLLSPLELGVESVDEPPPGTPAYFVHPLETYELSATIGATASDDVFAHANATDGLYIPYNTRSSPVISQPFRSWFCPIISGEPCNGLAGAHAPLYLGGADPDGEPFDVVLHLSTAHLNQALWAQARRTDRLGAPRRPARLTLEPGALKDRAVELGYLYLALALTAAGDNLGVRYHQAGVPYTLVTDPPHLIYVVPNVIVELVTIDDDAQETVVAKLIVDVVDRDLQLTLGEGGSSALHAAWGDEQLGAVTTTFLPGCYGPPGGGGCEEHLREVVGSFLRPVIEEALLDMVSAVPAPQAFDAGQESSRPRHLTNTRTFLDPGLSLFGDLCRPGTAGCN